MSSQQPLSSPQEAGALARQMGQAFRESVEIFQKYSGLSREEAARQALEFPDHFKERVLRGPVNEIDWQVFYQLLDADPQAAADRWGEFKKEALDELQSGERAAMTLEYGNSSPWDRARFLALRDDLMMEWKPTNGIERQLIDTMALAQASMLDWMNTLAARSGIPAKEERRDAQETGRWQSPRVSDYAAIDQAAGMVDRFNKIYLRTLRALRDLRRYSPTVIVQNAGQVNVAGQQVNMNAAGGPNEAGSGENSQSEISAAIPATT